MRYLSAVFLAIDSDYFKSINTGLGNVLFTIASTIGIAKELNLIPVFPRLQILKDRLKNMFDFDHGDTIYRNVVTQCDIPIGSFKLVDEEAGMKAYGPTLVQRIKDSSENIIIHGYLESFKYFEAIQDEIRNLFRIDDKTKEYIYSKYSYLLNSKKTLVAIHFRGRPDFAAFPIDFNFYRRAIAHICENVNDPLFLIFTDNKNCVDQSMFTECGLPYEFIENNLDYQEIYIMSMCKHNIIHASTFAWWGAFLNENPDKIIVYDKKLPFEYLSRFTGI
jgi:hypothetical protein